VPRVLPRGWGLPLTALTVVVALIAVIVYAVIQSTQGTDWADVMAPRQTGPVDEEQDQSSVLPGQWIDPVARYPDSAPRVQSVVPFCEGGEQELDSSGKPTCYASNPPTSGPHNASPASWGIHEADHPVPKEDFLHNMERGGVVVAYNCAGCEDVVNSLREIVGAYADGGRLVVLTPYPEMELDTIALASWSRLDKFSISEFEQDRVRRYVEAHERRFNPEGL